MIREKDYEEVIDFIESVGLRDNNVEKLCGLSSISQEIANSEEIFKIVVIKWFSEDKVEFFPLIDSMCKKIINLDNYEFKNRKIDTQGISPKKIERIILRCAGWFFIRPKIAFEFISLLYEALPDINKGRVLPIILDIYLINYLTTLDEYAESKPNLILSQHLRTHIAKRQEQIRVSWAINELKHSASLINEYEIKKRKEMEGLYKKAHEKSIISKLATPIQILYGNGSIYYVERINSQPTRQESVMGTYQHSFENAAMMVTDIVGLEAMLVDLKYGEIK